MKTLLIIAVLLFPAVAHAEWSDLDKKLFTSYVILSAIDVVQTAGVDGNSSKEMNPIFSRDDGTADMGKVIGLKVLLGVGVWFIVERWPEIGTEVLVVGNVIQGGVVVWNFQF